LTAGRVSGALVVTARHGRKVATEKIEPLRKKLTAEGRAAPLADAEKRWNKDKLVTADVNVEPLGGVNYRIIDIVFKA
jgi:plasmid stability protein